MNVPGSESPTDGEAVKPSTAASPDVNELCKKTFQKLADYLHGELTSTSEDYRLLENMNRKTIDKYDEMKQIASTINRSIRDLDARYDNLLPYLEQIEQVDEAVANLEQAAYRLDAYSKRLETKFKL